FDSDGEGREKPFSSTHVLLLLFSAVCSCRSAGRRQIMPAPVCSACRLFIFDSSARRPDHWKKRRPGIVCCVHLTSSGDPRVPQHTPVFYGLVSVTSSRLNRRHQDQMVFTCRAAADPIPVPSQTVHLHLMNHTERSHPSNLKAIFPKI
ncbi:hypothetical protein TNCT_282631, partial [Trichonephila clavata]